MDIKLQPGESLAHFLNRYIASEGEGYSIADLGRQVGLSRSHMSLIVHDKNQPSIKAILNMAKALNQDETLMLEAAGKVSFDTGTLTRSKVLQTLQGMRVSELAGLLDVQLLSDEAFRLRVQALPLSRLAEIRGVPPSQARTFDVLEHSLRATNEETALGKEDRRIKTTPEVIQSRVRGAASVPEVMEVN